MSTILDSLKKSSDQRDDNKKASIDNFNFGNEKKSSKFGFYLLVLLMAVTTAAVYWGYDYLFPQSTTQEIEEVALKNDSQQSDTNKSVQTEINKANHNKTAPQSKNTVNDSDASRKKPKPNSDAVKQEIKNLQAQRGSQKNRNKKTLENTKQSLSDLKKPKLGDMAAVGNKPKTEEKQEIKLTMPEATKKKTTVQSNQKKKPRPKQKMGLEKQKYMYVYQLPFNIRKDMPKFKLNIHVYDENPENRIAIINGVRFMVDDMIEDQVLVKDIVKQGVLLEFNNQEFLIPKL